MAGILDFLKTAGATALDYATPDALFGNVGKVGHRRNMLSVLQPDPMQAAPQDTMTQPVSQPMHPQGIPQGVKNGFGILDRVLGGQTITSAMNSQREVQQQRAMEPQIAAARAQRRSMLDALHDSGQINDVAYFQALNDPESFGKMTVNQYDPKVVSPSGSVYSNGSMIQAGAAPEKPEGPKIVKGDDGIYLVDPASKTSTKLSSWTQFAPRAAKSGKSSGGSDAPPSGFVLD